MAIVQDVLLRVKGQWEANEVERGLSRLNASVGKIFGLFAATELAHLTDRLVGATVNLVNNMVRLNKEYEQARISIATVISTYNNFLDAQGKSLDRARAWTASLREAEKIMKSIREEAVRTPFTMEELRDYVKVGMGFGYAKGLSGQEIVRTISMLAQAAYTAGLPGGYPVISEIRAILTGQNLRASQVAQMYGLTERELKTLRGEDYLKYLRERLRGIEMASEEMGRTISARWTTLVSSFNEIVREIGTAILPVLEEYLAKAKDALERWKQRGGVKQLQGLVRELMEAISSLVNGIITIASWLKDHQWAIGVLESAIGAVIGAKFGARFGPKGALIGGAAGAAAPHIPRLLQTLSALPMEESPEPEDYTAYEQVGKGTTSYTRTMRGVMGMGMVPEPMMRAIISARENLRESKVRQTIPSPPHKGVEVGTYRIAPIKPRISAPEETVKTKSHALEEARRAKLAMADVIEDKARQKLSSLMREYGSQPYSDKAASGVVAALKEWEKAVNQKVSLSQEGLHPMARQALILRHKMDLEEMRRSVQDFLGEWKSSTEKKQAEEEAARQESWERWYAEQVETYGGPVEITRYRAWEAFKRWYPRVGLIPALMSYGREILQGMEIVREQKERESSSQIRSFFEAMTYAAAREEERRRKELAERARREVSAQEEMSQYAYRTIHGALVPPRGLRGERAERWQLRRAYEMLGTLGTMSGMGVLPLGAYEAIERLQEFIGTLERRLQERVEAFWESMAQGMESAFREAFVRMGEDLLSNLSRWKEAFSRFAQTIKSMLIRAIMEALYERVVRRLVDQLIDVVVGSVSGGKGGGGGKRLVGGAVGAAVGGLVGGPVGALVGGFLGGLFGGRQWGGSVYPRRLYLVGERGPELFAPAVAGNIVPMERAPVGGTQISVNVTAPSRELAEHVAREIVRELRLSGRHLKG